MNAHTGQKVWEWRSIPGWEGLYEVSDGGQVRSIDRDLVLTARSRVAGYPRVDLYRAGERKARKVHTLVALAFLGPRPDGLQIAHYDGDKTNNTVSNLRYATPRENSWDTVRQGLHPMLNRTHCLAGGHLFSPENIYWLGRKRRCATCHRERYRIRAAAKRAEGQPMTAVG